MANAREADAARAAHQDSLMEKYGAHAVQVAKQGKTERYELIAHFEQKPPRNLPSQVEVEHAGRKVKVPLRGKKSRAFRLE